MNKSLTQAHVNTFLSSMDTVGTLSSFAELLFDAQKSNPKLKTIVGAVANWVSVQRELIQQQLTDSDTAKFNLKDTEMRILSIWLAHQEETVTRFNFSPAAAVKKIANSNVAQFNKFTSGIEDDFFTELLRETEIRANRNKNFSALLNMGEQKVNLLLANIEGMLSIRTDLAGMNLSTSEQNARKDDDSGAEIAWAIFAVVLLVTLVLADIKNDD